MTFTCAQTNSRPASGMDTQGFSVFDLANM